MRRYVLILLLTSLVTSVEAQRITRSYRKKPLPSVLIDIDNASQRYTVNFIYNELEDFTVTADIRNLTVPEAIREAVGYYPMKVTVEDSLIFVECTQKTPAKVVGRVVDSRHQPIFLANVALLNPRDSSLVNGGVTNSAGDFVVPCEFDRVLLRVSYIGYETVYRTVRPGRVGTITMKQDMIAMKTVTVKGSRKVIKSAVDRLQYLVDNDPFAKSMNGIEVMGRVPLLSVNDDIVSVMGKGSTHVMIDGRILEIPEAALRAKLRSMKSEDIERIEVITIPPAKYKAEANAGYVNIVMKHDQSRGWSGSVSEEVQRQYRGRSFTDLNLNYASPKFEMSTNAHVTQEKVVNYSSSLYEFDDGRKRSTQKKTVAPWPDYDVNTIMKFRPSKRLEMGVMASLYADKTSASHDFISVNTDTTFSHTDAPAVWNSNVSTTLYADYKLDSLGKTLSLNYNFFNANAPVRNENVSVTNGVSEYMRNESQAKYRINALKMDFALPFKKFYMETGASFSDISNKTVFNLENLHGGEWMHNSNESNDFRYHEKTLAAYLSVRKKLSGHLQAQIEARYEYTWTKGDQRVVGETDRNHYGRLFPSIHLNWQPKDGHSIGFAINWGLNRPSFNDLNPFRVYTSATDYMTGNPYLTAAYTRNTEINYNNGHGLYVVLYNDHGRNETGWRTTFLPNGGQMTGPYDGVRHDKSGLFATYNRNLLSWMNLTAEGEIYYHDARSDGSGDVLPMHGWGKRLGGTMSMLLNRQKTFVAEVSYRHWFTTYFAQIRSDANAYLRFNLRYSCLDDRLRFNFMIGDPFHQNISRTTVRYAGYVNTNRYDNHARFIGMRITWSFGGKQVKRVYHDNRDTESQRAGK